MKLTLIYVKVVKYFPFWYNFILNVPASSAQKLLPRKSASKNKTFPEIANIHKYTSYNNEIDSSFQYCFIVFVSCY